MLLDGEAPGPSHGVDVDDDGSGVLRDGRMYQLVRAHDTVRERTLEITFLEPGAAAYSFTFGYQEVFMSSSLTDTDLRDGYADLGDARLHYVEAGDGPLVVLLHGFPEFW